jgi:hypothetical protein
LEQGRFTKEVNDQSREGIKYQPAMKDYRNGATGETWWKKESLGESVKEDDAAT